VTVRISVDPRSCLRYGVCAMEQPDLFALEDDDETARVLQNPVPDPLVARAEAVVDLCPMQALTLED